MQRQIERLDLVSPGPGSSRQLQLRRYGEKGQGPKAYIQASLHADEIPAMMVAHHLAQMLDAAAERGEIQGEIVLLPYANPVGLAQFVNGGHTGRYDLRGGGNFNRNWPDLAALIEDEIAGKLGEVAEDNVALIRAAMREALAGMEAKDELSSLRLALAREACDADLLLDMHCDDDALLHCFLIPAHWPDAQDLVAELGCRAALLAEDSGGASFDEAFSTPWTRLAAKFPEVPIPAACLASTLEFRGAAEVSDAINRPDAAAIYRLLQRRGMVAGDPGPLPPLLCEATRLDATESLRAPANGILSYAVELGAEVKKGDPIAELIDPAAENPAGGRRELRAGTDGLVLSRKTHKYVAQGMSVAKIVGTEPLESRKGGYLLED